MAFEPLIPYLQVPELVLVPKDWFGGGFPPQDFSMKPFGTLVAVGAYVGAYLAVRQARKLGLEERAVTSFVFWIAAGGFIGGHVLDTLFYYPGRVLEQPLSLLMLWEGQSSFGGFCGALGGALGWCWRYRAPFLPYADVVASAFPVSWMFGRAGCALAHDHPGRYSELWLAVRYPGGGRFDLGLYEMALTIPIAIAFLLLRKKPKPWGFFLGTLCLAYAPTRFALDFLRATEPVVTARYATTVDPRYGPFTPAQWAALALLAVGAVIFFRSLRGAGTQEAVAPPPAPAAFVAAKTKA